MQEDVAAGRLLAEEVGDELIVYDRENHRAHHLNPVAAFVWKRCGSSSVDSIAAALEAELQTPVNCDLVQSILEQLGRANLLPAASTSDGGSPQKISRRTLLQRAGLTAAALPVITSIVVPTPAQAASGQAQGRKARTVVTNPAGKSISKPTPKGLGRKKK